MTLMIVCDACARKAWLWTYKRRWLEHSRACADGGVDAGGGTQWAGDGPLPDGWVALAGDRHACGLACVIAVTQEEEHG